MRTLYSPDTASPVSPESVYPATPANRKSLAPTEYSKYDEDDVYGGTAQYSFKTPARPITRFVSLLAGHATASYSYAYIPAIYPECDTCISAAAVADVGDAGSAWPLARLGQREGELFPLVRSCRQASLSKVERL
ncbi:hypothetical protein NUW54_g14081 [Trametes sanguinea]|uniref:Uncharacterized protein n=1 Tax=Trametes sanguinea TaxID=158606 RepID=A0ACC1MF46_9APHY|nr:hypothetical protein NUW54_g14081 [Trametes sanguinea]